MDQARRARGGVAIPAVSQAQRGFLFAKFGKAWAKRHGFDNPGKLPEHVAQKRRGAVVSALRKK